MRSAKLQKPWFLSNSMLITTLELLTTTLKDVIFGYEHPNLDTSALCNALTHGIQDRFVSAS